MTGGTIAQVLDDLLRAQKAIVGAPDWKEVGHRGEHRLVLPLMIDNANCPADLELNAYPNIRDLRFRIMLRVPQCIWRIDYVDDEHHVNPLDCWDECGSAFTEPHYHSWADNRRFAKPSTPPDPMPVARALPPQIRQFDAAFRWFCGETNIEQMQAGTIDLPPRSRLL
jgi:hypothetical protein